MGLSRVSTFEGLNITDLCENKIAVLQDVAKEMDRLRTSAKLSLCVSQLYDITGSLFKLCNLNARSVHRHIEDLRKDLKYSCADKIFYIFAETRFSCQDPNDMYDITGCLLYTSPSPRDLSTSRMPSSA